MTPYFNDKLKNSSESGFTILEMLVAVFIFSLSLVSLVVIAGRGILVTNNAINRTTAQFLAQEGVEIVESQRNDDFLTPGVGWQLTDSFEVFAECFTTNGCYAAAWFSSANTRFKKCNITCPFLKQRSDGFFGYDDGVTTIFTRRIRLKETSPNSVIVESIVEWEDRNSAYSVDVKKNLTNWFKPGSVDTNPTP